MPSFKEWQRHFDIWRFARPGSDGRVAAADFLAAMLGLMCAGVASAQGIRAPRRVDLGTVFADGSVEGSVNLWNSSETTIRVFAVEASCPDCTTIDFGHAQDIAPGESLPIHVIVRGNRVPRDHFSELQVRSSDPDRPMFGVAVLAHFVSAVAPVRPVLDCGVVRAGESVVVSLRVLNRSQEPIRIALSPYTTGPSPVSVRFDPVVVEGTADPEIPAETELSLSLHLSAWSCSLSDIRLAFSTGGSAQHELTVPLRGLVLAMPPIAPLAVTPFKKLPSVAIASQNPLEVPFRSRSPIDATLIGSPPPSGPRSLSTVERRTFRHLDAIGPAHHITSSSVRSEKP